MTPERTREFCRKALANLREAQMAHIAEIDATLASLPTLSEETLKALAAELMDHSVALLEALTAERQ